MPLWAHPLSCNRRGTVRSTKCSCARSFPGACRRAGGSERSGSRSTIQRLADHRRARLARTAARRPDRAARGLGQLVLFRGAASTRSLSFGVLMPDFGEVEIFTALARGLMDPSDATPHGADLGRDCRRIRGPGDRSAPALRAVSGAPRGRGVLCPAGARAHPARRQSACRGNAG